MEKKFGAFSSSHNPQELSLTIKSIAIGLVPLVVTLLGAAQITLDSQSALDFINTLAAAFSAIGVAYGSGRKIYYMIKNK
jgi:hypothetical protein